MSGHGDLRHCVGYPRMGVQAGRSACESFTSPKTLSVHVSNLRRKIGVTSRVQAAAWGEHVGLTVQRSNDRGV